MARLINKTKNSNLTENVIEAKTFYTRLKGLLGEKDLKQQTCLWIASTSSIHTFFMKFNIDVIFIDRKLRVKKCISNLGPWRVTLPSLGATSVFELPVGTIKNSNTQVGDQLDVVS